MSKHLKLSAKAIKAYAKKESVAGASEVLLYGVVGLDFNLATVLAETKGLAAGAVLRIHSPGGDAHEGLAIYEALKGRGFIVRIDGLAASAASLIAMAGTRIVMAPGAQLMLHNPWTMAEGDGNDLRAVADVLDKIRDSYVDVYVARTGLAKEKVMEVMDSETFWSAAEVAALGFGEVAKSEQARALALAVAALAE